MGLNKRHLADNYRRMEDQELLSILSNDYKDLTADAQEALKEELNSRKMGEHLDEAIELKNMPVPDEKIKEYLTLIQNLPCPYCLQKKNKLNGALVLRKPYTDFVIGCPECLKEKLSSAKAESLGFALLAFPKVFKEINNIVVYQAQEKQIDKNEPSDAFILFLRNRISEIALFQNNSERLSALIKNPNAIFF